MPTILPCRLFLRRWKPAIAALAMVATLAGCVHEDTPADATLPPVVEGVAPESQSEVSASKETAYTLLQQAETAVSPQKESLLLQVVDLYQQQGDETRAGRVLHEIDAAALDKSLLASYSIHYGEWALGQRHLDDAARVLLSPELTQLKLTNASSARLHGLRARLYDLQHRPLDALHELLLQSALVPDAEQMAVSESIWHQLSLMTPEDFRVLEYADTSNAAEAQLLAGWLALARVARDNPGDLDKQSQALRDWERSYPVHPANRFKPVDMALLAESKGEQPGRIVLLLPLSGKRAAAGQSVRDGFMTMHYQSLSQNGTTPQVDLVDSSAGPDIVAIYNAAVAQGAQMVIGPLEKEQVQALANLPALPVPTLALNNPPQMMSGPGELYQFSLNPEEEAAQVAAVAADSRMHKAVIVAPQGERGERLTQAFTKRWQSGGGEIVGALRYTSDGDNYNTQLADVMKIDLASGQLKPGAVLPDMVFFVGTGSDAAAVMDALAKIGVSKLPVYATSQAFAGQKLDSRINGLRLCLAPWQAGVGPLRSQGDAPANADILFAMGADAQMLQAKLSQMSVNPSLRLPANTGYLNMDNNRIVRTLVWATVQEGRLQVQPAVDAGRF